MITPEEEKEQKIAFSKRLRHLRRINDLSQQQTADALGVTPKTAAASIATK